MATNVAGLFDSAESAHMAVSRLIADGIPTTDISAILTDPKGVIHREVVDKSGDLASAGAVSGAASGLIVGGLIGLLIGATTIAAPPVGLVIAGPLAGFVTGATFGMAGGGLIGGLIGLGIPEEEAHVYLESVRRGSTLVTVNVTDANRILVEQVLAMSGAVDIAERSALYRSSGFTTFDPKAPAYVPDATIPSSPSALIPTFAPAASEIGEEMYIPDDLFMEDYWSNFAPTGVLFNEVRPAYRFGYDLATRPEFRSQDWDSVVNDALRLWEASHPGTWEQYRGAIHTGWSKAGVRASMGASLI